jgi:PilZ domain
MTRPGNHKPHANLPPGMERRSTPRFECDRGVQCWKEGSHATIWGTFIDLSVNGCSIQTLTPLPPGTRLSLVFTLYGSNIRIGGEVRTLEGYIMGIAFAAMARVEQDKLSAAVRRLADGRSIGSEEVINTQAAVQRLQRWFKTHDLLTRERFQQLLDGSFDPALESSASPLMAKASGGFAMAKPAADPSKR